MTGKRKKKDDAGAERREYRTPTLTVHGDLREMTLVKRGSRNDGRGKPRTRASGPRT